MRQEITPLHFSSPHSSSETLSQNKQAKNPTDGFNKFCSIAQLLPFFHFRGIFITPEEILYVPLSESLHLPIPQPTAPH